MTETEEVRQPLPQKKKFRLFKKKDKFDADGNEIYIKKKKLYGYNRLNRSFAGDLILTSILIIGGVFMIFPLIFSISNSLKPLSETWKFPPNLIVKNPTFQHYIDLFNYLGNSMVPMSRYFFNSILLCVCCSSVQTISCSMCAYALSKREFKGQQMLFKMVELSLMFSAPATGIVSYIIVANMNPIDSYWPIIAAALAGSFNMYIIKNFIDTFPTSILEAARIDGANEFKIFWKIAMPGCKPAWMTVILFSVQAYWGIGTGDFVFKEEMKSVSAGLEAITSVSLDRSGVSSAMSILLMIVPFATFIITQSNVMETCATAGMKD